MLSYCLERSKIFLENVNCTQQDTDEVLACLRKIDAMTILNNEWVDSNFMVFPWAPVVDGEFLTDTPASLLRQGKFAKKETILGANKEEGTFWISYVVPGLTKDGPSLLTHEQFRNGVEIIDWDLTEEQKEEVIKFYIKHEIKDTRNREANRDALDKVGILLFVLVYE